MITDVNDPRIRTVRELRHRKERERTGLFFAEGVRFTMEAAAAHAEIRTVVVAPRLLNNAVAARTARRLGERGVEYAEVSAEVFGSLSTSAAMQGIGIVARQQWESLRGARVSSDALWVAVDTLQSPGNLGTILRTCDSAGADGLILIGDSVDPYDPHCVRATMGAIFSQRLARTTPSEVIGWKRRHGVTIVGTSPSAARDYRAVSYRRPTVLYMGWERQGISEENQRLCDTMVRIPMCGRSDSLNVAVATGVMLYEAYRSRNPIGGDRSKPHKSLDSGGRARYNHHG